MAKPGLVGQRVCLRLESWGRLGEATAHIDGLPVFVFGGIPGEEVVAEVIQERRRYISARVVEVVHSSPHRVEPPCPYFGACTGCQWQHIDYDYQLKLKRDIVVDSLERVGGFHQPLVADTVPSPDQYGYRNHARFTIGNGGSLGFVNRENRQFVPIDNCMLMDPGVNRILGELQGHCGETSQLSVRYGVNTGDFLVQPTLKSTDVTLPTGQKHYTESLRSRCFHVASPSFFQVNIRQVDHLVDLVRDGLQITGSELILDAYAGVGTFALLLMPYVGKVIAIEESPAAIQDARANATGVLGVEFIQGKIEEVLGQLEGKPHGVILDPPRKGCHRSALEALDRLKPQRVVYVSCDPASLARDLKVLCQGAFLLEEVRPVDMFPQTHHVECVVTLSLRRRVEHLVLASSSPRRRELVAGLGVSYEVMSPEVNESPDGDPPEELVRRLALAKAQAAAVRHTSSLVVGADTTVVLEGRNLGKPRDDAEAVDMLNSLREREHRVITGVALVCGDLGISLVECCESTVVMRNYSDQEIEDYVATGEARDKAGGYGVQSEGFHPAARVDGCYTNVVGLPLCAVASLLRQAGYDTRALHLPEGCIIHLQAEEKRL